MRKTLALLAISALLALGSLTTAQAGSRVSKSRADVASKAGPSRTITLQRLLGESFARALKLVDAFQSVTPVGAAPNTIIDEPDPAGKEEKDGGGKDERKDAERTDEEKLEGEIIDPGTANQSMNPG